MTAKPSAWTRNITMLEWRMSIRSLIRPQIKVEPKLGGRDDRQRGRGDDGSKSNIGDIGKHMEIETGDANIGHAVHETDDPKRSRADDFAT